MKDRHWELLS
jgi:dynein heavy chain